MCVNFFQFYVPYVRPGRNGIALRLDKWAELVILIPIIYITLPQLTNMKCCIDQENHLGHLGWLTCYLYFPSDR